MINNEDILNLTYRLKSHVTFEVDTQNLVTVMILQDHWLQRGLRKIKIKIPQYSRTGLDEYSSFVFLKIDGNHTIKDIGEALFQQYGDQANPLYERLLLFINHLETSLHYIEKV